MYYYFIITWHHTRQMIVLDPNGYTFMHLTGGIAGHFTSLNIRQPEITTLNIFYDPPLTSINSLLLINQEAVRYRYL